MTDIRDAVVALYDRFTHERMDRRVFMAELTRIAGGAAAASLALSSVAAGAAEPVVPPDDPRIRTQPFEWEVAPDRVYTGYNAARPEAPSICRWCWSSMRIAASTIISGT